MKHKTAKYLLEPLHPVSVVLVGVGGTGSHMLNMLGKIHSALVQLGHLGLFVTAYDDDIVEEHNQGRQNFSAAQVNGHKAIELMTVINRFYGTNWQAFNQKFKEHPANITISCTDTIGSRKLIATKIWMTQEKNDNTYGRERDMKRQFYWLDIGNSEQSGQICLASTSDDRLPGLFGVHPELRNMKDKKNKVTCSMAESLQKQDLLVNSIMANYAGHMLWTLFSKLSIDYHTLYINLKSLQISKIEIK